MSLIYASCIKIKQVNHNATYNGKQIWLQLRNEKLDILKVVEKWRVG